MAVTNSAGMTGGGGGRVGGGGGGGSSASTAGAMGDGVANN